MTDSTNAIILSRALSSMILRQLLDHRDMFAARFGRQFVSSNDDEMMANILSLPEESLAFVDKMHEAELGDAQRILAMPQFHAITSPLLIYRTPPTYAYIHQLLLYPRHTVTFVNQAFESEFGWQVATFNALGLEPCHIVRSDDLISVQYQILRACLSGPSVGAMPDFLKEVHIMRADGQFRLCRTRHYTIRSGDLTPVYGVFLAEPLDLRLHLHADGNHMLQAPDHEFGDSVF
jgi:hypothetical protein